MIRRTFLQTLAGWAGLGAVATPTVAKTLEPVRREQYALFGIDEFGRTVRTTVGVVEIPGEGTLRLPLGCHVADAPAIPAGFRRTREWVSFQRHFRRCDWQIIDIEDCKDRDTISALEYARMMAEAAKTGANFTMPSGR